MYLHFCQFAPPPNPVVGRGSVRYQRIKSDSALQINRPGALRIFRPDVIFILSRLCRAEWIWNEGTERRYIASGFSCRRAHASGKFYLESLRKRNRRPKRSPVISTGARGFRRSRSGSSLVFFFSLETGTPPRSEKQRACPLPVWIFKLDAPRLVPTLSERVNEVKSLMEDIEQNINFFEEKKRSPLRVNN